MLSKSFALLATAALALASPLNRGSDCYKGRNVPQLPKTGASTDLSVPSDVNLKAIILGFGIQNYTCEGAGAEAKATGALATLYEITDLYPSRSRSFSQDQFNSLTANVLTSQSKNIPLNLIDSSNPSAGANVKNPWIAAKNLQYGYQSLSFAGHHYFDAAGVPTFDLKSNKGKIFLPCSKKAETPAPANASAGPEGTGAVAWLQLAANPGASGAKYVYRVLTAGGKPHQCTAAGTTSTSYTTQYWFYN